MTLHPEVIVVGSHAPGLFIRVNRIPLAGETVIGWDYQEPIDGGKGSNQAIAAARLGALVSFVGCVGKDRIGIEGEQWMKDAGVDTSHLQVSKSAASGVGFILLDDTGIPAMVTSLGANAMLSIDYVENALRTLTSASVLLTQLEIYPEVALAAIVEARRRGMITILNPAPAPKESIKDFRNVDILIPNEIEAKNLLGVRPDEIIDPICMANQLRKQSGSDCVIITIGEDGAVGAEKVRKWRVKPPKVNVIDTSGAGDVFCAAMAVRLAHGDDKLSAAKWACKAATLSVTKPGTIPSFPTLIEVNQFI